MMYTQMSRGDDKAFENYRFLDVEYIVKDQTSLK